MRIVFMGTPRFSVPILERLNNEFKVIGVFTQPDRSVGRGLPMSAPPVKLKALELGLPIWQPEKLVNSKENEELKALAPGFIVVVGYGQILKSDVLELPQHACVNIHTSLLPRWRGAAPVQRAILAGDAETGVTTMLMAPKLDAGDILLQSKTPIEMSDTAETLSERLCELACDLIVTTLHEYAAGNIQPQKQDDQHVTYAEKLTKDMERITPTMNAIEAHRRVRALVPWPGTSFETAQLGRVKILDVGELKQSSQEPGLLLTEAGKLWLSFKDGVVELTRLQMAGKGALPAAAFVNGLAGRKVQLPVSFL